MTGQIPKYGEYFRRESLPFSYGLASRKYVLKANPRIYIRSDNTSERWMVYMSNAAGASFPMGKAEDTMSAAMDKARALYDLVGKE